jgi:hypothetical protein
MLKWFISVAAVLVILPSNVVHARVPNNEVMRCPKFEPLFEEYGLFPVETFSYIAWRESRCRIKAINALWDDNGNMVWALNSNKTWDSGLLQINSTWKTVTRNIVVTHGA